MSATLLNLIVGPLLATQAPVLLRGDPAKKKMKEGDTAFVVGEHLREEHDDVAGLQPRARLVAPAEAVGPPCTAEQQGCLGPGTVDLASDYRSAIDGDSKSIPRIAVAAPIGMLFSSGNGEARHINCHVPSKFYICKMSKLSDTFFWSAQLKCDDLYRRDDSAAPPVA